MKRRTWMLALGGLALLAATVVGGGYGQGGTDPMTAASGSATIATATSAAYTFSPSVHRAMVHSHATGGPSLLYVRFNANTCSPTNFDFVLEAGDACFLPDGMRCPQLAVYNGDAGTITYGTDFVVKGWE